MISCGPSKADLAEQARQDSIRMADSIQEVKDSIAKADSIWNSFTTSDLKTFELKGHVMSVILDNYDFAELLWGDEWGGTYPPKDLSFSQDGSLLYINHKIPTDHYYESKTSEDNPYDYDMYVERDHSGNIQAYGYNIDLSAVGTDYDPFSTSVERRNNGEIAYISMGASNQTVKVSIGEDGNARNIETKLYERDFETDDLVLLSHDNFDIKYEEYDEHGNWTCRKISHGKEIIRQKRVITYWDKTE